MPLRPTNRPAHLIPFLSLGLFSGRLLSELLLPPGQLAGAAALTAVILFLSYGLSRRFRERDSWPALLLLAYVVAPAADPGLALDVAAVALLTWLFMTLPAWRRPSWPPALLAALAFGALYVATLAPGLLPADSGEFQIVAATLGVAHPPGFPLYTLLAHLATRLPLAASPAYQVNLFSAFTSALTLAVVYLSVQRLTQRHPPALVATAALGTAVTFWAQATTANIRSLTALFAALMLYALLRFYQARRAGEAADRWLIGLGLALGFGVTHHASLAFMGLIGLLFLLTVDPGLLRAPRRWPKPLLAALLGLLPLLYLPLRAQAAVRGADPGLATLDGFLNHALARGFRGDLFAFSAPGELWERMRVMGDVLTFQFAPALLAGMALGLALLLRRDRRAALLLGGAFLLHTYITAAYRAPQTVEYMLPAYVAAVVTLGLGLGRLEGALPGQNGFKTAVSALLTAVLLVAAGQQGWRNYPSYAALAGHSAARAYAQPLLEQAPPGSLILADWHWATPLWYLQEVEQMRPDVSVRFVYPTGEPYADTWARQVGEALAAGQDVISTHYDGDAYAALPAPEPLDEALLFRQAPRTALPADFTPFDLVLGGRLQILGYRLDHTRVAVGEEAALTVAWRPMGEPPAPLTLFAHLVGGDGGLYAQNDVAAAAQPQGITLTQLRLTPRPGAQPGDYALLLGAYGTEALPDRDGQPRTPLATLAVAPAAWPPATQQPLARRLAEESGRRLVGYDWDNTLPGRRRLYLHWQTAAGYVTEVRDDGPGALPPYVGPWGAVRRDWPALARGAGGYYVPLGQGIVWAGAPLPPAPPAGPGEAFTWSHRFLSGRPVERDYVVSVRLIGYQGEGPLWGWWDLDDSVPAMGAMPTLKWIGGSRVRSPHFVRVAPTAAAGQALGGALTLYDAFTGRPLPILDERITAETTWVPLGRAEVGK